MFSVYGDESADETKQRVFAVAGVIGTEDLWDQFQARWTERTGGKPFHAKDCDCNRGDYSLNSNADNKALYRDLATLLAQSGLAGWGHAIDLAARGRVFPEAPDIAYYQCFLHVLDCTKTCAQRNGHGVKFTFDTRQESEYNAGELYTMFRNMSEYRDEIFPEVSFARARDFPRIQVADLFARETMKALDNQIGPEKRDPRKSLLALRQTGRFHVHAQSIEFFENLKQEVPKRQQESGLSGDNYASWLRQNKLQDNTTNLFRFIAWLERQKASALATGSSGGWAQ